MNNKIAYKKNANSKTFKFIYEHNSPAKGKTIVFIYQRWFTFCRKTVPLQDSK